MGFGYRVFFVEEDGTLRSITHEAFDGLRTFRKDLRFREYAGRKVRCAVVFLQTINDKPASVTQTHYMYLHFDKGGRLDPERQREAMALSIQMTDGLSLGGDAEGVVRSWHRFARKRYDLEFRWEPSNAVHEALMHAVFGA